MRARRSTRWRIWDIDSLDPERHGLADEGILALDRKQIRVLDLPALLKLAD